ncbi:MAG: transposase [Methylococcales bacterium]|nr:transposase [Methylococcales bacterium]
MHTNNEPTICIVDATLAMTGRVTMLGISRWSEKGGSYRTVQRFFKEGHNWSQLRWLLIKQHLEARFESMFGGFLNFQGNYYEYRNFCRFRHHN